MFIKNLPKYLFWFTLIVIIISFVTLFIPEKIFCKAPEWLGIFENFHIIGQIILFIILLIVIILLVLSIFVDFKRRFLWIVVLLSIIGIVLLWVNTIPTRCPDDERIAGLRQLRTGENIFFKENQQYADYDQLIDKNIFPVSPPVDPETGERYLLVLSDDKQDFEIKAKLDRGGWYVCNKDGCEKQE